MVETHRIHIAVVWPHSYTYVVCMCHHRRISTNATNIENHAVCASHADMRWLRHYAVPRTSRHRFCQCVCVCVMKEKSVFCVYWILNQVSDGALLSYVDQTNQPTNQPNHSMAEQTPSNSRRRQAFIVLHTPYHCAPNTA